MIKARSIPFDTLTINFKNIIAGDCSSKGILISLLYGQVLDSYMNVEESAYQSMGIYIMSCT